MNIVSAKRVIEDLQNFSRGTPFHYEILQVTSDYLQQVIDIEIITRDTILDDFSDWLLERGVELPEHASLEKYKENG